MTEPQETWSRQAHESAKAYRAFMFYVEMDVDRSLAKVGQKLGVSRKLIERWSAQYDWVSRARDYDAHVSERRLARLAIERERLADEQVELAAATFRIVKSKMKSLRGKSLNAMGVARLFYVASQVVQNVFGNEQPLSESPPKIVVLKLRTNTPRDFDAEARERGDLVQ